MEVASPSFAQCRQAARSIRAGDRWKIVRDFLRPRTFSWFRSRLPIALLLFRSGRDGCLLWESPHSLIVVAPPAAQRRRSWLDRWCDTLMLFGPSLGLLIAAVVSVALRAPMAVQVSLVSAFFFWPVLFSTIGMVADLVDFARWFIRNSSAGDGLAEVDRVLDANWSVRLLHGAGPGDFAEVTGGLPGGTEALLIPAEAVTGENVLTHWRSSPQVSRLDESGSVLVMLPEQKRLIEAQPIRTSPHAVIAIMTALSVLLLVAGGAYVVAPAEKAACGSSCGERPATYGNALYWLLNRLSGGDPNDLGAATLFGRFVGIVVTTVSVVVVAVLAKSLANKALEVRRPSAVDVGAAFNASVARNRRAVPLSQGRESRSGPPSQGRQGREGRLVPSAVAFIAGTAVTAVAWTVGRRRQERRGRGRGR
ncbi:hypothetical protein JIG36_45930 [Actinoplanes sp. LDG1-06]|uniref:Uncharacterized protein n=1 Tax=Paractinoplanes ovalisporus TaxID=2810368 RepID=A0ABS2AUH6_9ACTN|nr:hypothetical protein [Actinoplanes ovalisporus]MBM2622866.1 hypothetical protein [Actinoplanes ovalisporus]